jgi:hypothetical protein
LPLHPIPEEVRGLGFIKGPDPLKGIIGPFMGGILNKENKNKKEVK